MNNKDLLTLGVIKAVCTLVYEQLLQFLIIKAVPKISFQPLCAN